MARRLHLSPSVAQAQGSAVPCVVSGETAVIGEADVEIIICTPGQAQAQAYAVPVGPLGRDREGGQGRARKPGVESEVVALKLVIPGCPQLRDQGTGLEIELLAQPHTQGARKGGCALPVRV